MIKILRGIGKGNAISLEFDGGFLNKLIIQSDCEDMEFIIKNMFEILDNLVIDEPANVENNEYSKISYVWCLICNNEEEIKWMMMM